MSDTPHRCGTVALVGRPNVGKSTFLNQALGTKLSITSHKPQTTRNRVVGIHTGPGVQAILVDTPGHHEAWSPLNRSLVRAAEQALEDVDVVCLMVDLEPAVKQARAGKPVLSKGEEVLLERVIAADKPTVLALNKVDAVERDWVLPVIDAWRQRHAFTDVVPFSARDKNLATRLLDVLGGLLPEGEALYPEDQLSDSSERFIVSEIIREKVVRELEQELPYATAVVVEHFQEPEEDDDNQQVRIFARILVERPSQKGIVVGKGGATIKRIGTQARVDIKKLLGCPVHLDLQVSVARDWTRDPRRLRQLGYEEQ